MFFSTYSNSISKKVNNYPQFDTISREFLAYIKNYYVLCCAVVKGCLLKSNTKYFLMF